MAAKEAWGLDIGYSAIRLVKLHRQKQGVVLSDLAVRTIDAIPDDPDYEEKMISVLAELIEEKKIGSKPVVVSQPGSITLFRDFPLPAISSNKLQEIVSYEARQQIPYPLEEVLWDFHQYKADPDSPELNIALVCIRRDFIENLLEINEELGMNIVCVQPGPVALANFIQYDQPPEGTVMLLDAGVRATDFLVLRKDNFWLRSIPVCGSDVTKALITKFNMEYAAAEELKLKMGESKQADRVFQVVVPVLRSLAAEIQRSLGYYKSLYRGVKVDGAICAGGTFKLAGVDQFMADDLGMPVSLIQELSSLEFGDEVDADFVNENIQCLGVAIGLALQGIGEAQVSVNLLPPEIQTQHKVHAKVPYALAAVVLLIISVVISLSSAMERSVRWTELNRDMESSDRAVAGIIESAAKARSGFGPEEEKNRSFAQESVEREFVGATVSSILNRTAEINRERAALQNDGEITKQIDHYLDAADVKERLASYSEYFPEEEDLKSERDKVRKQAEYRAKLLASRKRQLYIEELKIEADFVYWFVEKKDVPVEEEAKQPRILLSPEDVNAINALRAKNAGSEPLAVEKVPVSVAVVTLKGYSVSTVLQRADVTRLRDDFKKLPGIRDLSISDDKSRLNSVPVPQFIFAKKEEEEKGEGTSAGTETSAFKREWDSVEEETREFTLVFRLLSGVDKDGILKEGIDGKKFLTSDEAAEKAYGLSGIRFRGEERQNPAVEESGGTVRARGRKQP